ncbi:MAG TPA: DegT/DnrJ/EryC1/StrS family aminotransferase [Thermoleophilaceae bacterium]|jgi:dTDP-4-amino-4,6-dideoxygalactose transaminase
MPAGGNGLLPGIGGNGARPASDDGVPLTRLDNADPYLLEELMLAVERVAHAGAFTLGEEVEQFEEALAAYCGTGFAVGVSSGTDALALALRGLGVGPGDEVIVPANSFVATAEAVTLAGARPRLADVDPATHLLTADIVERNLSTRTRCVIPVHLHGRTVELAPIMELARDRGVSVIEDACQAHGAIYRGQRVGSIGDAGCFSFYPAKNLGAWGDGGAVVTSDPVLTERIRLLRSHGERPRYHHRLPGGTWRLHAIQAAILRVKLARLDGWNADRRRLGAALCSALADCPALEPPAPAARQGDHVFHVFAVTAVDRERLRAELATEGIATAVHYPVPIHLQDAYAHLGMGRGSLPVAERLAERICTLPLFPGMTDAELDRVVQAVWAMDAAAVRELSA